MKKNKKVLVLGSGFAGLACCLKLIEHKFKPTVIDYNSIEKQKLSLFDLSDQKKNFFYNENFSGIGGQSSVWTGIVDKYTNKELENLLNSPIESSFYERKVLSKINTIVIKKNFDVSVMVDKKNNKITRLDKIYKKLIKHKKINFINSKIYKILQKKNKILVNVMNKFYEYDYVFLCCGSKSVVKLLPSYHSKNSKIIFSQKFLIPTLINKKILIKDYYFPVAQYSLKEKNKNLIYVQIYSLSQILERYLGIKYLKRINILNKLGFIYLSASSDLSDHININKKKTVKNHNSYLIKKLSIKLFKSKEFYSKFKYFNFFYKLGLLAGNHYGGNLPISNKNKKGYVNFLCQPSGNKKMSILGSSVFKYVSAIPPTLTIFFFSYHKTKEIINKLF